MEKHQLRKKETEDMIQRERNAQKLAQLRANKAAIQVQIDEAKRLKEEAYNEYLKEKN
jgi:hypothetical protein